MTAMMMMKMKMMMKLILSEFHSLDINKIFGADDCKYFLTH